MQIEYEATFTNINKDEIRQRLIAAGAKQIYPEFLQKRIVFDLPENNQSAVKWVRLRQEQDKITLSIKEISGEKIEDQKEILLTVDNWDEAREFLVEMGCLEKAYQENKRELWELDGVEVTIDEWPFLEPFVEIEGKSEADVKKVSEKIGFDYSQAIFGDIGLLYKEKYNLHISLSDFISKLVFEMANPFL